MREFCPHCDDPMLLLKPLTPDPDVLVWVCVNTACACFRIWVIEPNWGKWFSALKLTPAMIEKLVSLPIQKTG